MKVGLVCPYDLGRPGGVQQQVLDLGRLLAAEGEQVTMIGPGAGVVDDGSYRVVEVGRVRPIRANGSVVPLAVGFDVRRRVREISRDLDVLHVHEPLIPMVGPAALRAGRPTVATFHAVPPDLMSIVYRAGPAKWFNRRRFRNSVMTAVSPEAARGPGSLGPVAIIPNGLDVASYSDPVSKRPGRVVFLGRDEPRKGLAVLMGAWPRVLSDHPDATLVVIGAEAPAGQPSANVEFLGWVNESEKRRRLAEASVMVAPNLRGESFGLVLVEAMASGCAVIASDIPAFRAVVGAAAAELVTPGSSTDLASAISRLLAQPSRIETLGRAGLNRANEFDWSRVLPRYRESYEEAIEKRVISS